MLEQRNSVRSPPPEGEGMAKTSLDQLTPTPNPCSLHCRGGEGREFGSDLPYFHPSDFCYIFFSTVQLKMEVIWWGFFVGSLYPP